MLAINQDAVVADLDHKLGRSQARKGQKTAHDLVACVETILNFITIYQITIIYI